MMSGLRRGGLPKTIVLGSPPKGGVRGDAANSRFVRFADGRPSRMLQPRPVTAFVRDSAVRTTTFSLPQARLALFVEVCTNLGAASVRFFSDGISAFSHTKALATSGSLLRRKGTLSRALRLSTFGQRRRHLPPARRSSCQSCRLWCHGFPVCRRIERAGDQCS